MKKLTLYTTAAAAVFAISAANASAEINPVKGNNLWFVSGHAEAGIYYNQYGNNNQYDRSVTAQGPLGESGNTGYLRNVHNADGQLNQAVLSFGKKLDKTASFDVGGRVDYMFGTDARFVQSSGLEENTGGSDRSWGTGDYYSAIAQAYLEAGFGDTTVKAGKFLTPMGHNSIMSTDRFFYSLPVSHAFIPGTLTGVVVDHKFNDSFSAFAGWANGENQTFDNRENNAALIGARYDVNQKLNVKYTVLKGEDNRALGGDKFDYWVQSLEANYKVSDRLDYMAEWTYRRDKTNSAGFSLGHGLLAGTGETRTNAINQELIYKVDDQWSVGGRAEYIHMVNTGGRDNFDAYSFVAGANWTPEEWLVVRPELRYDINHANANIFDNVSAANSGKDGQIAGGVSVVVKF